MPLSGAFYHVPSRWVVVKMMVPFKPPDLSQGLGFRVKGFGGLGFGGLGFWVLGFGGLGFLGFRLRGLGLVRV